MARPESPQFPQSDISLDNRQTIDVIDHVALLAMYGPETERRGPKKSQRKMLLSASTANLAAGKWTNTTIPK